MEWHRPLRAERAPKVAFIERLSTTAAAVPRSLQRVSRGPIDEHEQRIEEIDEVLDNRATDEKNG